MHFFPLLHIRDSRGYHFGLGSCKLFTVCCCRASIGVVANCQLYASSWYAFISRSIFLHESSKCAANRFDRFSVRISACAQEMIISIHNQLIIYAIFQSKHALMMRFSGFHFNLTVSNQNFEQFLASFIS